MRSSEPLFFQVRGLRYHVRRWAASSRSADAPKMVLLHGWMDVSASFQFFVDALRGDWDVYAPDWRGYGLTQWGNADCYWFPDYIADLDELLRHLQPSSPVNLVGHSLGGNVAALYAGVRPARVAKLVNLEGFGMPPTRAEEAPRRYARWLDELCERPTLRPYKDFEELAQRLRAGNPRLSEEKAHFLARHWGREAEGGSVVLRGDPAHKIVNPVLYRVDEAQACWQQVGAPVLWVEAAQSDTPTRMKLDALELAQRRSAFPNVQVKILQEAGHMLHHDQPEALARLVESFLAG